MRGTRAAYIGPGMELSAHRNAVTTIAIGLEAPFDLRMGTPLGDAAAERVAIIPGGRWHHLTSRGAMTFLYLDDLPAPCRWSALSKDRERVADRIRELAGRLLGDGPETDDTNIVDGLVAILDLPPPDDPPERIAVVARAVAANPDEFARIATAATLAGLSSSRFQRVFTRTVGVAFGRYRQWCRMGRVARAMAAGESLTDAALDAGFSSSAHLSSAFRAMFGIKPSDLVAAGTRFRFDEANEFHAGCS